MARHRGPQLLYTWNLTAEQLKDPKNIWDKLALIEPPQNFRIKRLELQRLTQKQGESTEDFCTQYRTKALSCQYADNATIDEHILEQLITGTNM